MKNLFNPDSPLTQKLAMVTNLIILNMVWLICCIPVVTAGAATTALYYTVFQYITKEDDTVFRPFFHSFRQNFRQATLLWLPLLVLLALLVFDFLYLLAGNGTALLWIAFLAAALVYTMLQTHLFPLLARFEMTAKALFSTAFSLFMLHLPTSLLMMALNLIPLVFLLLAPAEFLQCTILWLGIWFSLAAYLNGRLLLKLWSKHIPEPEKIPESADAE